MDFKLFYIQIQHITGTSPFTLWGVSKTVLLVSAISVATELVVRFDN